MANMRSLLWLAISCSAVLGCSKQVSGLCCTDAGDCAAAGLPSGSTCDDGLACRGHQCVAEVCSASSDCDATAPYCASGLCTASCSSDSECPGATQDADDRFCISGACVQCRNNDDCSASAPICASGTCRGCFDHAECDSQACTPDGPCATQAQIAHVSPEGANAGDCGAQAPCTLVHALALDVPRPYLVLEGGTYRSTDTVLLTGQQALIGIANSRPILTRSTPGPVISIGSAANIQLANVEVSGATTSGQQQGFGVDCEDMTGAGAAMLWLVDTVIGHNMGAGIYAHTCSLTATRTVFEFNGDGIGVSDRNASIDRCTFRNNGYAINADSAVVNLTNSFLYRNTLGVSIATFYDIPTSTIAFNTIVDNTTGIDCKTNTPSPAAFPNNIIVRNTTNTTTDSGFVCTYPGSIIADDIAALHFVQPNVAPYDYHLEPGSVAIDAAQAATLDHDFDGDARPKGKGRDVGADEVN